MIWVWLGIGLSVVYLILAAVAYIALANGVIEPGTRLRSIATRIIDAADAVLVILGGCVIALVGRSHAAKSPLREQLSDLRRTRAEVRETRHRVADELRAINATADDDVLAIHSDSENRIRLARASAARRTPAEAVEAFEAIARERGW